MKVSGVSPKATTEVSRKLEPEDWVDAHGDYLYRYALRLTRRQEAAEDLVQETLLAAWRGREQFGGLASERSWLTAILKRKIIDWLRRTIKDRDLQSLPAHDESVDGLFGPLGKWRSEPRKWSADTPDSETERSEFWEVIQRCADKLPSRLREVFVLWHLEDEPSKEVCRSLKISSANLWTVLHRSRMRMWQCLTENWFDPKPSQ